MTIYMRFSMSRSIYRPTLTVNLLFCNYQWQNKNKRNMVGLTTPPPSHQIHVISYRPRTMYGGLSCYTYDLNIWILTTCHMTFVATSNILSVPCTDTCCFFFYIYRLLLLQIYSVLLPPLFCKYVYITTLTIYHTYQPIKISKLFWDSGLMRPLPVPRNKSWQVGWGLFMSNILAVLYLNRVNASI